MFADGTTGPQAYAGQITYDHTNNRLTFGTNDGTTGLTIDSSQRVGIGTTAPISTLDVKGGLTITSLADWNTKANTVFELANPAVRLGIGYNSSDQVLVQAFDSSNASRALALQPYGGNVGIGTSSPSYLLDVSGSANLGIRYKSTGLYSGIILDNSSATGGGYVTAYQNGAQKAIFGVSGVIEGNITSDCALFGETGGNIRFYTNGSPSEKMRLDTSGQLGIGVTNPGQPVSILSPLSAQALGIWNRSLDNIYGGLYFKTSSGGGDQSYILNERAGTNGASLLIGTKPDGGSPVERIRISNLGAFKASTNGVYAYPTLANHEFRSTIDTVDVVQINHAGTNGSQYGVFVGTANDQNNTTLYFLACYGGATQRATIRSNGGLANYQANDVNLSDINVKKDISPAADTWNCIKKWEIVNYRYKDQSDDSDLNLGVIAQQIAQSCPEVITLFQEAKEATEDKPAQKERLGVKEQQMYWMAIKALQEAMERIETLEAEVAALKAS
jgi:hypothetical protein